MTNLLTTNGLKKEEVTEFTELLIKANTTQLLAMKKSIENEIELRISIETGETDDETE